MAQSAGIKLPASQAMSRLTLKVRVTGLRVLGVRMWLGSKFIKLGALIIGCGIEFEGRG